MFKTATSKLTAWYLGIVMVISLGFSIVVYHFAVNELNFGLNHQTERIGRQFPMFNNNPILQVHDNDVNVGAHHILLQLAYFNVLVLAGAGFASYWLARRTLEPIEAAHERQKRFTADVSHELRTPLTSLKMNSEVTLLDQQASKNELRTALQSNIEDATRMGQLVNSLLRLTRLDSEEIEVALSDIEAKVLVKNALEQVKATAEAKQIRLQSKLPKAVLRGDSDSLQQLLIILLDNAIKYSPKKSAVHITNQKTDKQLLILIQDEGQGISPAALPHVFERFYREDSARTTEPSGDGYGLGLSIAKMIAEQSNASISLTSELNKGTTATVSIPLATVQINATEQPNQ
jgi:signal transduction histidine kinase